MNVIVTPSILIDAEGICGDGSSPKSIDTAIGCTANHDQPVSSNIAEYNAPFLSPLLHISSRRGIRRQRSWRYSKLLQQVILQVLMGDLGAVILPLERLSLLKPSNPIAEASQCNHFGRRNIRLYTAVEQDAANEAPDEVEVGFGEGLSVLPRYGDAPEAVLPVEWSKPVFEVDHEHRCRGIVEKVSSDWVVAM